MAKYLDLTGLTTYDTLIKSLINSFGKSIDVSIDTTTYVMTIALKDGNGTTLSTQQIDLPLESVVVNGTYDSTNKKIILTLVNGNTIDIPISDLVNGLVDTTNAQTIGGAKTFSDEVIVSKKETTGSTTTKSQYYSDGVKVFVGNSSYKLVYPLKNGTIATTGDIPSLANCVDKSSNQTIGGEKTFTSGVRVGSGNFIGLFDENGIAFSSADSQLAKAMIADINGFVFNCGGVNYFTFGNNGGSSSTSPATIMVQGDMVAVTTSEINALFS